MNTLLLRLEGPMQSWGVQSRFPMRDTIMLPSKSGVVGLLCAALGRPRPASVDDLTYALKMGVREDREGTFAADFQTTMNVAKAKVEKEEGSQRPNPVVSPRYYLADACFLVGLESDDLALLRELHSALANPHWPLFLGRKSFVPSEPVLLHEDPTHGLHEDVDLLTALQTYRWLGRKWQKQPEKLRFVVEHRVGDPMPHDQLITQLNDQPLSFDIHNRLYAPRRVRTIIEAPRPTIFEHQNKGD